MGSNLSSVARITRAVLLAGSFFGTAALAQGTAVLTGTVTDAATKQPVADVVVTATSPALQGEQIVVTDASGLYRIPNLPPGTYTIRLEKEGYKPFSRGDIPVRVDRTIRVNIDLLPEALEADEVVVVGAPPTIDVGSTTTGINVGTEFTQNVAMVRPSGTGMRSFESLASIAPQVVGDTYGFGVNGTTSPENQILVDGLSVTDPAYGINGSPFPIDFVQEANVITGGYQAEYGRATGGVMNVVTKSGSNEFHGSVFGNWTPGFLASESPPIKSEASVFVSNSRLWNSGDFGAELGGPILKDKLWFYVGFSPSFSRVLQTRSLNRFLLQRCADPSDPSCIDTDGDGNGDLADANGDGEPDYQLDESGDRKTEPLPGTEKSRFVDSRAFSYIAKLTYNINQDQNVSVSWLGSPTSSVVPYPFTNRVAGTRDVANSNDVSLKYQGGFLDKHLLIDATLGWHRQDQETLPNDGSRIGSTTGAASIPTAISRRAFPPRPITDFESIGAEAERLCNEQGSPEYACPATGLASTYTIGGAGFMEEVGMNRYQGKLTATYLLNALGHHVFKAGIDLERNEYRIKKAYSGGYVLRDNFTGSAWRDYRQYAYLAGPDDLVQIPFVESTSSSVGVGAFLQNSWSVLDLVTLNLGLRYETQHLYGGDGQLGLALNNMLAPRVGVIYDFTQHGRSKIYGSYARYFESVPLDIADRSLTGENQAGFNRLARPVPGGRPGCDPVKSIDQTLNECLDPRNAQPLGRPSDPNQTALITGHGKVPVDPNLQPQSSDEIILGADYEVVPDGRAGLYYTKRYMNHVIEDMSRDEANTYFIGNPGYGIAKDFPKATRDYNAVTAYFNKSFTDLWMAQVSYTYSTLYGNYPGLFRPETGQLDPNINADFDLISLLPNREGPLPGDRTHVIKAFGAKEFPVTGDVSLRLGLTYEASSGRPINYLASHPLYGPNEAFVLPRGSGGRLPWVHSVSTKLGASYKLTRDNIVSLTVDIFNLFNFAGVTAVDETFSTADLLPATVQPGQNPQEQICYGGNNPNCVPKLKKYDPDTGAIVDASAEDYNPNFKRVTGYQAPRQVRFGVKVTF